MSLNLGRYAIAWGYSVSSVIIGPGLMTLRHAEDMASCTVSTYTIQMGPGFPFASRAFIGFAHQCFQGVKILLGSYHQRLDLIP